MSESEGMADPRPLSQQVNSSGEFCCDWSSSSYSSPMREMEGNPRVLHSAPLSCLLKYPVDDDGRLFKHLKLVQMVVVVD